jgi:hypothetical protein
MQWREVLAHFAYANILRASALAALMLDNEHRIRRFTPFRTSLTFSIRTLVASSRLLLLKTRG